jgi:hypothetical protein
MKIKLVHIDFENPDHEHLTVYNQSQPMLTKYHRKKNSFSILKIKFYFGMQTKTNSTHQSISKLRWEMKWKYECTGKRKEPMEISLDKWCRFMSVWIFHIRRHFGLFLKIGNNFLLVWKSQKEV